MKKFLPIWLVLCAPLSAAIVSTSIGGSAFTKQSDYYAGTLHLTTTSGVPSGYNDPLAIDSASGITYTSQASTSLAVIANTPTYLEYSGYIASYNQIYRENPPPRPAGGYSETQLEGSITFNLDTTGVITFLCTNTSTSISTGLANNGTYLTLDGTGVYSDWADTSFSIPLAAGEHTASFFGLISATFGSGLPDYSEIQATTRYKIQISSVPEPSGAAFLICGVLLFTRLRRIR